jgi:hypothetical protein
MTGLGWSAAVAVKGTEGEEDVATAGGRSWRQRRCDEETLLLAGWLEICEMADGREQLRWRGTPLLLFGGCCFSIAVGSWPREKKALLTWPFAVEKTEEEDAAEERRLRC